MHPPAGLQCRDPPGSPDSGHAPRRPCPGTPADPGRVLGLSGRPSPGSRSLIPRGSPRRVTPRSPRPPAPSLPEEAREEGLRVLHLALGLGQQRHRLRLLAGVVHGARKSSPGQEWPSGKAPAGPRRTRRSSTGGCVDVTAARTAGRLSHVTPASQSAARPAARAPARPAPVTHAVQSAARCCFGAGALDAARRPPQLFWVISPPPPPQRPT